MVLQAAEVRHRRDGFAADRYVRHKQCAVDARRFARAAPKNREVELDRDQSI